MCGCARWCCVLLKGLTGCLWFHDWWVYLHGWPEPTPCALCRLLIPPREWFYVGKGTTAVVEFLWSDVHSKTQHTALSRPTLPCVQPVPLFLSLSLCVNVSCVYLSLCKPPTSCDSIFPPIIFVFYLTPHTASEHAHSPHRMCIYTFIYSYIAHRTSPPSSSHYYCCCLLYRNSCFASRDGHKSCLRGPRTSSPSSSRSRPRRVSRPSRRWNTPG